MLRMGEISCERYKLTKCALLASHSQKGLTSNLRDDGQWRTQEICSGGGVQQIQLRTEERDNGDLGAVAP